ncbi:RNA 2'-phosphotransferase [Candidatus Poribacteria bacterium]|nr:RNA 2'-phosphotransferase [Candidatus Poribacteria bacterium]
MEPKERTKRSRFLSLVLRHDPGRVGITLDEAGWVRVADLLEALARHGAALTREELDEIVATNDKQRFAFSADGTSIRASQGHSVKVELGYTEEVPPSRLYHGTTLDNYKSILQDGINKGRRHAVHLSATVGTAIAVGRRHGIPIVVVVLAGQMHERGHRFFRSANGVWLTEFVPAEFTEPA